MAPANAADILQAFENTSTNVAASQMRNALNKLSDTVTDPKEKKVSKLHTWTNQRLLGEGLGSIWVDWYLSC